MLKELNNTRQIQGEAFRRWFSGNFLDLIVWYSEDQNDITGFQLCYRKDQEKKALTWLQDEGYTHTTVDDGEGCPGRHKMSPILIPDGIFNNQSVLELFQEKSKQLDKAVVEFISHKIRECPSNVK